MNQRCCCMQHMDRSACNIETEPQTTKMNDLNHSVTSACYSKGRILFFLNNADSKDVFLDVLWEQSSEATVVTFDPIP